VAQLNGPAASANGPGEGANVGVESLNRVGELTPSQRTFPAAPIDSGGVSLVGDDADDLPRGFGVEFRHHSFADYDLVSERIALRPVTFAHRFVDDDDRSYPRDYRFRRKSGHESPTDAKCTPVLSMYGLAKIVTTMALVAKGKIPRPTSNAAADTGDARQRPRG
jgi:hypothetical protein